MKLLPKSSAGYTLVEILIVILIISIVTSVALLSINRNENKQLEAFANELTELITLAEEQAMLQPAVIGLSLNQSILEFTRYQRGKEEKKIGWQPLDDAILSKIPVPSDIQVNLQVQNKNTKQGDKTNSRIIVSTNGDVTPFVIYVGKKGKKPRYAVIGEADGSVANKLL